MTDYFGALAMRTLEPELGVQPRRRAPFETIGHATTDATEVTIDSIDTSSTRASQLARNSEDVSKRPATRRRDERAPAVESPVTLQHSRETRATSQVRARGDDAAAISEVPHPTVRELIPVKSQGTHAADARAATSHPRETRDATVAPVVMSRRAERPGRDSQVPHASETTNEPVIRIHIGRVDVRAVTQPAPTPAAPRGTRHDFVTLESYVQQRSGGQS